MRMDGQGMIESYCMKRLILWSGLVLATGLVLSLTSCAGLKISVESELDANAGSLLNLFE